MYIVELKSYVHPTFLYESSWNLVGLLILLGLRKVNLRQGEIFFTYLIWYSIGRFFIEGMRTDSLYLIGELRSAQLVSIVCIFIGLVAIIYRRINVQPVVKYLDMNKPAAIKKPSKSKK